MSEVSNRLIRLLPGIYYLLEHTGHWKVRQVTEQAVGLLGYRPSEIVAMSELFPETIIHPDDLEAVRRFKRESTEEDRLYELEYRVRTRTGEVREVLDRYTCYRDERNVLVMEGYLCELHHLRQETILHQLRAYRHAVDVNMIASITDRTGMIIYANENFCRISKYSMTELLGQNHRIVNSGQHNADFFRHLWKTISGGAAWHGEIRNKAKDGTFYWVDTVIIPIFDHSQAIVSYLSLRTLINDRKQAEESSRNYTDMLEKLAFMVAHDIRGPLCSILGLTNVLLNYTNTSADMDRALEYLNKAAVQLDTITRKLAEFVNEHDPAGRLTDPLHLA